MSTEDEVNLAQELNDLKDKRRELAERLKKLSEEELENLKNRTDLEEKVRDMIEAQIALQKQSVEDAQKYLNAVRQLGNSYDENNLKLQAEIALQKAIVDRIEDKMRSQGEITSEQKTQLDQAKAKLKFLKEEQRLLGSVESKIKNASLLNNKYVQGVMELGVAFKRGGSIMALDYMTSIMTGPLLSAVSFLIGVVKKLFFEVDNVTNAFERAINLGDEYSASLQQNYEDLRALGITIEDVSRQTQVMISSVSDFTLQSQAAQREVTKIGARLERVGVSMEDFAKGAQNSMKMFGMDMIEAGQFASELTETARELGVTPQEMASDFARVGGSLAKLGRDGPQAFKELARVSKITGLEIEKLINLTSKFDTFEDAATMTGQLNAALGGNFVNAMDMMMTTDPVARFEQLRDAISSTGLTFDDMSYYQRQFFANAMGLESVGDLALLMSGNMDMLGGAVNQTAADYEEQARQAQATMSIQEKFNSIMASLAPLLVDLMDKVHGFLDAFLSDEQNMKQIRDLFVSFGEIISFIIPKIAYLIDNWEIALGIFAAVKLAMIFINAKMALMAIGSGALATALGGLGSAAGIASVPIQLLGIRSGRAGAGVGRLGVAVGGIAAKLMLLGLAIGAILFGFGYLVSQFVELFRVVGDESENIFNFAAALSAMAGAGTALLIGAVGISAFAVGLFLFSAALVGIDGAKLQAIADFATGLGNMDLEALKELDTLLTNVAEAMQAIPEEQATSLTATMNAAVVAAKAVQGANLSRANTQGTANNQGSSFGARGSNDEDSITVDIDFNDDMFSRKVIRIMRTDTGRRIIEEIAGN